MPPRWALEAVREARDGDLQLEARGAADPAGVMPHSLMARPWRARRLHPATILVLASCTLAQLELLPAPEALAMAIALFLAVVLRSRRMRQAASRVMLLWMPLLIAGVLVSVAGQPGANEPYWAAGARWALGPARVGTLVPMLARSLAILALGQFTLERATTDSIRRWSASLRLPPSFGRTLLGTLALIRSTAQRTHLVKDAQALRGIPVRGSVMQRAMALPMIAVPLIASVLTEAAHRSVTLERRGFATHFGDMPAPATFSIGDVIVAFAALAIITAQLFWRVFIA